MDFGLAGFDIFNPLDYFQGSNIINYIIIAFLSERINNFLNEFVNDIIIPFIDTDLNGDGIIDVQKVEDYQITLFNKDIKIGRLVFLIVKFIILIYLVYFTSRIIKYITK